MISLTVLSRLLGGKDLTTVNQPNILAKARGFFCSRSASWLRMCCSLTSCWFKLVMVPGSGSLCNVADDLLHLVGVDSRT